VEANTELARIIAKVGSRELRHRCACGIAREIPDMTSNFEFTPMCRIEQEVFLSTKDVIVHKRACSVAIAPPAQRLNSHSARIVNCLLSSNFRVADHPEPVNESFGTLPYRRPSGAELLLRSISRALLPESARMPASIMSRPI
jgi:hypothetical protein